MADVTGKLFVVQKHMTHWRGNGQRHALKRRKYYELPDLQAAEAEAARLAGAYGEDFVVVQIMGEASKPEAPND